MYATERQELIERLLADDGRVSVVGLAQRFEVTTETVRRDLDQLEAAGSLRRVHGGAVARDRVSTIEPSLPQRLQRHGAAKSAIGARALSVLSDAFRGSIYLDAGTTTASVAAHLAPRLSAGSIEVVTHSLTLAHALAEVPNASLTLIGGRVRGLTAAAVGADTVPRHRGASARCRIRGHERRVGRLRPQHLPTPKRRPSSAPSSARRAGSSSSRTPRSSARELLVGFAPLAAIDVLVTDAAPDDELATALADADVEVWLA